MTVEELKIKFPLLADYIETDKSLYCSTHYLVWKPGDKAITLDDEFTLGELAEIIEYIRTVQGDK